MAARAVAIVGARLNSSRLPGKHLLDLAGRPLVGRLLDRLATIKAIDKTVIATTADDYNKPLVDWARADGASIFPFAGDVDDLVGRIDAVVQAEDPDIVVYICGDCPLIEPSTLSAMIKALQGDEGVDVARLDLDNVGGKTIHEGFSVYSRRFWDQIVEASQEPFEREHVGVVFARTGKVTPAKIASVPDDPVYSSIEHRISVDTPSDYRFIRTMYERWFKENGPRSIVPLAWVIGELKKDQSLVQLNADVKQKDIREQSGRVLFLADARPGKGLGHIKRCLYAADIVRDRLAANVQLLALGCNTIDLEAGFTKVACHESWDALTVQQKIRDFGAQLVIVDFATAPPRLPELLIALKNDGVRTIGVDTMVTEDGFDRYYVPSFHVEPWWQAKRNDRLDYGWDSYLLPRFDAARNHEKIARVIVMTGGGDPTGLAQTLPSLLDAALPVDIEIGWVRGPAADYPNLDSLAGSKRWQLIDAPDNLAALLPDFDAAITSFGVSFFEALAAGLHVVTHDPIGAAAPEAWQELEEEGVALLVDDLAQGMDAAIKQLLGGWVPAPARITQLQKGRGERFVAAAKGLLDQSTS